MTGRFTDLSDGAGRGPRPKPTWPTAPGDPDESALGESWAALDGLLDKSGAGRMDLASASRLVREVERRTRRRKLVQWGGLAAAAAVLLLAVGMYWRLPRGDEPAQIAGKAPTDRPLIAMTGTKPRTSATSLVHPTVTPTVVAPSPAIVNTFANDGPQYWHDPLDEDLQSARAYAGEVENSWRRRGDRWAGLRDQVEQLQTELNESPL